eukprot:CFRG7015T1
MAESTVDVSKHDKSNLDMDYEFDDDQVPQHKTNKLWTVCVYILVVEMCERLAYYTFAGSQKYFLMHIGYDQAQATSMNAAFSILCYWTPLFGGWLADAVLGRFKTIVYLTALYIVGVFMAAIGAEPNVDNDIIYLIGVMGFVALGSGGIKPNVSNFGGDQYDVTDPEEARQQESFFSYFYMMINIGAAVSYGYLTTLAVNGQPPGIPQEYGFFTAYMIASGCMAIAYVIFLLGSKKYIKKPPSGDPLRGIVHYLGRFWSSGRQGKSALSGWVILFIFMFLACGQSFASGNAAEYCSYICLVLGPIAIALLSYGHADNSYMVNEPDYSTLTLRECREALETVPTLLVVNVCFSITYNTMNGPLQSVGCQMDCRIGGGQINASFFNIGDCFAIIIFVPILENFVFPIVTKMTGKEVTRAHKLISGMTVAILAMISAIAIEFARQSADIITVDGSPCSEISECADNIIESDCYTGSNIPMRGLSAFLIFIPFVLIGIGEILVNPVCMYFVYDQAPPRTRSVVQAFNMMCMGAVSNGFTAALTTVFSSYMPNDIDLGDINVFFYIGIAGAAIGIPLSMFVMKFFHEKDYTGMDGLITDDMGMEVKEDGGLSLHARESRRFSVRE